MQFLYCDIADVIFCTRHIRQNCISQSGFFNAKVIKHTKVSSFLVCIRRIIWYPQFDNKYLQYFLVFVCIHYMQQFAKLVLEIIKDSRKYNEFSVFFSNPCLFLMHFPFLCALFSIYSQFNLCFYSLPHRFIS